MGESAEGVGPMKGAIRCLVFGLPLLLSAHHRVFAASEVTTTVTKAEVPFYPPLARAASVQGIVVAEVTTSGEAFGAIKIVSGHPLLSAAVTENLRTWVLVKSPTTTFRVTYTLQDRRHLQREARCHNGVADECFYLLTTEPADLLNRVYGPDCV